MSEVNENSQNGSHWLTNRSYDFLHLLAMVLLPAVGALYFALAGIWHFPNPEQVVGSITAFDAFLGVLLKVSRAQYLNGTAQYDGAINIETTQSGGTRYSLELDRHPDSIEGMNSVTFQVRKRPSPTPR